MSISAADFSENAEKEIHDLSPIYSHGLTHSVLKN